MIKWKAFKKCNVLVGGIENQKETNYNKVQKSLDAIRQTKHTQNQLDKLLKREKYWLSSPDRYKINLEAV